MNEASTLILQHYECVLAFAIYFHFSCADSDNDILFLLNERPLHIAGCNPNGLCKQSLLLERFGRYLGADCMETFCTNNTF